MKDTTKEKYLLIPVNFDDKGVTVATYGITLARELGLSIKLLHVLTMAGIPSPVETHAGSTSFNYSYGDLIDERKKLAEKKLRAMSNRVRRESGLKCRYICKLGFFDIQVLEESNRNNIAMVVMGTPGQDTLLDQLIGSRSLKIVNHGNTPVLLVPNNTGYFPIKRIAVGANYEHWDKTKLKWLANTAEILGATLHFVRVADSRTAKEKLVFKGYKQQVTESLPDSIDHHFKFVQDSSIDHGIEDFAQENHVDLVALQRSEKSGWEHFFSDNVAKDMVVGTSLPVLIY